MRTPASTQTNKLIAYLKEVANRRCGTCRVFDVIHGRGYCSMHDERVTKRSRACPYWEKKRKTSKNPFYDWIMANGDSNNDTTRTR